jgi:hypothetical protein
MLYFAKECLAGAKNLKLICNSHSGGDERSEAHGHN